MKLIRQAISFVLISGTGFLLDFTIYYILTKFIGTEISYANMISSIPAITYVFFISTKKTFRENNSKINIKYKYLLYIIYQLILVTLVSLLAKYLYENLRYIKLQIELIENNLNIIIKLLITPITMTSNFIVMKILSEKI